MDLTNPFANRDYLYTTGTSREHSCSLLSAHQWFYSLRDMLPLLEIQDILFRPIPVLLQLWGTPEKKYSYISLQSPCAPSGFH